MPHKQGGAKNEEFHVEAFVRQYEGEGSLDLHEVIVVDVLESRLSLEHAVDDVVLPLRVQGNEETSGSNGTSSISVQKVLLGLLGGGDSGGPVRGVDGLHGIVASDVRVGRLDTVLEGSLVLHHVAVHVTVEVVVANAVAVSVLGAEGGVAVTLVNVSGNRSGEQSS